MHNAQDDEKPPQKRHYVYMVRCADGTLYCGYTDNLTHRMAAHNSGTGAKYTRTRRPVTLVYADAFETKSEAMSREWHVKKLSRAKKLMLIAGREYAEVTQKPD